jgi:YD repeat-containing protein
MKTEVYYHKNSDVIGFERTTYSNGYNYENTYDKRGNELTYKNSEGFLVENTYDKRGNKLTYKDSKGFWSEYTYDERGNELTYKNSNGYFEIKGKEVTREEFESFINRPCVGKKVTINRIKYELK